MGHPDDEHCWNSAQRLSLLSGSPLITPTSLLGLAHVPGKLPPQGSSHLLFSMPVILLPRCLPDFLPHLCRSLLIAPFSMRPFLTLLFKMTPLPTLHSLFFFPTDFFFCSTYYRQVHGMCSLIHLFIFCLSHWNVDS